MDSRERKEYMKELRREGLTYAEIGKKVGISKQRVYCLIGGNDDTKFKPYSSSQCIYDGLRNYLNEKKIHRTKLIRMIWGCYHPELHERISGYLKGREMRMSLINKILEVTGLTYEQAFLFTEKKEI